MSDEYSINIRHLNILQSQELDMKARATTRKSSSDDDCDPSADLSSQRDASRKILQSQELDMKARATTRKSSSDDDCDPSADLSSQRDASRKIEVSPLLSSQSSLLKPKAAGALSNMGSKKRSGSPIERDQKRYHPKGPENSPHHPQCAPDGRQDGSSSNDPIVIDSDSNELEGMMTEIGDEEFDILMSKHLHKLVWTGGYEWHDLMKVLEEAWWCFLERRKLRRTESDFKSFIDQIKRRTGYWGHIWTLLSSKILVKEFNEWKSKQPRACLIILNRTCEEVLVVKGFESSQWSFPGGKLEHINNQERVKGPLELPREAAVREGIEETGINFGDCIAVEPFVETVGRSVTTAFLVENIDTDRNFSPKKPGEVEMIGWTP